MNSACKDLFKLLAIHSEKRGGSASGLAYMDDSKIHVLKNNKRATDFVESDSYQDIMLLNFAFQSIIGHTRLPTKGSCTDNHNNHPIIANRIVGVHNGCIGNDDTLFSLYNLERSGQVDSEIIFRLLDMRISNGDDIIESVNFIMSILQGSYAVAFFDKMNDNYLTLFRGAASPLIYLYEIDTLSLGIFASEAGILDTCLRDSYYFRNERVTRRIEIPVKSGLRINIKNGKFYQFHYTEG
jgi:glucosamine 6-phosphate synthetase-like amidotransferase/phosphosugar isomerase protein